MCGQQCAARAFALRQPERAEPLGRDPVRDVV
jgi:hypothetical protein